MVLCNAFGQEAVRAHRLMRVLAERLVRQGHPVLRFDYFGTGDSMGDDGDGDLANWAGDVLQADAELRRLSGVQPTVWIGMRLGATIALQAAQQAPAHLRRLILWDTVLDGQAYLEHLRERHVSSLQPTFSITQRPAPKVIAKDPSTYRDEAIGYALSPLLREQLRALKPADMAWPAHVGTVALSDPDDADGRDLAQVLQRKPAGVRVVPIKHGTDWTSDTADNSALVPTQALMALVQHAGGLA
jgi:pimeloyl-ACP methyl ester carboxylesterase